MRLGHETRVVRNDMISARDVKDMSPQAVVLSPGPCGPADAGSCIDVVRACWRELPILGVCLGHQAIAAAFAGKIERAPQPWHGRSSTIVHKQTGVFANLPNPLEVGRYHSLAVAKGSLPAEMHVTAHTADGEIMAIQHTARPLVGLQFHPESVLTEHGREILANFLRMSGLPVTQESGSPEVLSEPAPESRLARDGAPVSF